MKLLQIAVVIMSFCVAVNAQSGLKNEKGKAVDSATLCEISLDPFKYSNKRLRVVANYRYSFEHSELYARGCSGDGRIWVEFEESYRELSKLRYVRMIEGGGAKGRILSVEFEGTLLTGGGFGHLGSYRYQFVVNAVRKAKIISGIGATPRSRKE